MGIKVWTTLSLLLVLSFVFWPAGYQHRQLTEILGEYNIVDGKLHVKNVSKLTGCFTEKHKLCLGGLIRNRTDVVFRINSGEPDEKTISIGSLRKWVERGRPLDKITDIAFSGDPEWPELAIAYMKQFTITN